MSTTQKGPGGLSSAVHNPAFFTGMLTGILLSFVMFGWLFAANRMPGLDRLAFFRNWICLGAFGFVMTIPILRFFRSPARIFTSGLMAWVLLCVAYSSANMAFVNLANRFSTGPFKLLVMGAVLYGVVGVTVWTLTTIVTVLRRDVSAAPAAIEVTTNPR
jgi:hypothetical protein